MQHPMRLLCGIFLASLSGFAQTPSSTPISRPKIVGISHLAVYATDPAKTADYYRKIVGCVKETDFETPLGVRYSISPTQYVEVLPLPANSGPDRLDHIAFRTNDAEGLRKYLAAHDVTVPQKVETSESGYSWLLVKDFEGNKVEFVQQPLHGSVKMLATDMHTPGQIGNHIIHIGIVIRDRAAADRFYKDILGFKLYWQGGMQPEKTDWVAMQAPDGTDWLEYMLPKDPATPISAMSQRSLGVMNHLSVGVVNMAKAVDTLKAEDRLPTDHSGPQIGKDGKWQLNLFDPDDTRLEYMEFTPVEKPCCSPFTGPHPSATGQ